MRLVPLATTLCLLALGAGCAHQRHAPAAGPWVQRNGGTVAGDDARQRLCEAALARLGHPASLMVRVLDNDAPTAYAFRAGRVYVTRALVDLASDDELAAAIAHELGHLTDRRKDIAPRALSGSAPPADAEARADRAALAVLRSAGVPTSALATLLEKVRTHPATPAGLRPSLAARIALLSAAGH